MLPINVTTLGFGLACGGLDIFCASCYGVVKGEQSSPIALEMPMAAF